MTFFGPGRSESATAVVLSPDGARFASCGSTGPVWVRRTADGGIERALHDSADNAVRWLAYSPDGTRLAASHLRMGFTVWDTAGGACVLKASTYPHTLRHIVFSPDGATLAAADVNGPVRLWDAATGAERLALGGPEHTVSGLAFGPDGAALYGICPGRKRFWAWDTATGAVLQARSPAVTDPHALACRPDGGAVALAGRSGGVLVLAVSRRAAAREPMDVRANGLAFTPDGTALATAGQDGRIVVWDVAGGHARTTLPDAHPSGVLLVAWHPDGRTLLSAGMHDTVIRIWDTADARPLLMLPAGGPLV